MEFGQNSAYESVKFTPLPEPQYQHNVRPMSTFWYSSDYESFCSCVEKISLILVDIIFD
jgi:hypothetical protein